MRKITSLFALLLLFAVTATAQTSVTVISSGQAATTYGSLSGTTFTTNDASGMAGVTVDGIKGTTATTFAYGACLALTSTSSGTITMTAPSGYVITGYTLTARSNTWSVPYTLTPSAGGTAVSTTTSGVTLSASGLSDQTASFTYSAASANSFYIPSMVISVADASATIVNVTYALYDSSDPSTLVSSVVVSQEANSAVSVPASLQNTAFYDYTVSGTIGDTDCTITVVRTLKAGIIGDLANLSNNMSYTIVCERGALSTYNGNLACTVKSGLGLSAKNFAIISKDGNYYLYSVDDAKFVLTDGSLSSFPTDAVTVPTATATYPLFKFLFGSKVLNTGSGQTTGAVIDTWTTEDAGNRFLITEAESFDPTDALAAFEDRTPYFDALSAAITAAEAMSFGTKINTFVKSSDYDAALAAAKVVVANTDATIDELTDAGTDLAAAIQACSLNMPTAPMFLRLRSVNGANAYLKANNAGTRMTVTTTADESTIFCYTSDGKLVAYSNGIAINNVREIGTIGGDANSFTFIEGVNGSLGTYSVTTPYNSNTSYLYSTGVDGSNADRNTYSASFLNQNTWTLEEVTELPFTISAAGQATLSLPTAWEVPAGVTVRYASVEHDGLLTVEDATATAIAADEAVILVGTPGDYTITLAASGETLGSILTSTGGGVSVPAETKAYILALNGENQVVFSLLNDSDRNIAGFKAYYISTASGEAPAFFLLDEGEVTGINAVNAAAQNGAAVYDLQGRRVSNAQKGVYIINGQKVLVK